MSSQPPSSDSNKKHSWQSAFIQCIAVPLFALIIYTLSKQLLASLGLVVLFYGNAFSLWTVSKLFKVNLQCIDAIIVVNISLVLLGLVLVSLSMGGVLNSWVSEDGGSYFIVFFIFYFFVQSGFVHQVLKVDWLRSFFITVCALIMNAAFCYIIFSLFFNS